MRLIGLTGLAGAGKDTVAQFLCETQGFVGMAFAAPLRAGLQAMFGLTDEQLDHITHGGEPAATGLCASQVDSFAVIAPKRPMRRFAGHDSAVKSAMAAASNGSGRGEVFALVHVGTAKRGAVWRPAK